MRLYVDEGPPVAALLARLRRPPATPGDVDLSAIPAEYLDRLLSACGRPADRTASPPRLARVPDRAHGAIRASP